jgi:ketosteroid isomerase-like protein
MLTNYCTMKIIHVVKVVFCVAIFSVFNTPATKAQQNAAITAVAKATNDLKNAMISADSIALSNLASDSLSYGHSGGIVQNKQQFIKGFTSKSSVFLTIDLTGQKITVVGNTAIVHHVLSATTNDAGKGPGTVKLGIMEVWVKQKNDWKLLARQAVKIN